MKAPSPSSLSRPLHHRTNLPQILSYHHTHHLNYSTQNAFTLTSGGIYKLPLKRSAGETAQHSEALERSHTRIPSERHSEASLKQGADVHTASDIFTPQQHSTQYLTRTEFQSLVDSYTNYFHTHGPNAGAIKYLFATAPWQSLTRPQKSRLVETFLHVFYSEMRTERFVPNAHRQAMRFFQVFYDTTHVPYRGLVALLKPLENQTLLRHVKINLKNSTIYYPYENMMRILRLAYLRIHALPETAPDEVPDGAPEEEHIDEDSSMRPESSAALFMPLAEKEEYFQDIFEMARSFWQSFLTDINQPFEHGADIGAMYLEICLRHRRLNESLHLLRTYSKSSLNVTHQAHAFVPILSPKTYKQLLHLLELNVSRADKQLVQEIHRALATEFPHYSDEENISKMLRNIDLGTDPMGFLKRLRREAAQYAELVQKENVPLPSILTPPQDIAILLNQTINTLHQSNLALEIINHLLQIPEFSSIVSAHNVRVLALMRLHRFQSAFSYIQHNFAPPSPEFQFLNFQGTHQMDFTSLRNLLELFTSHEIINTLKQELQLTPEQIEQQFETLLLHMMDHFPKEMDLNSEGTISSRVILNTSLAFYATLHDLESSVEKALNIFTTYFTSSYTEDTRHNRIVPTFTTYASMFTCAFMNTTSPKVAAQITEVIFADAQELGFTPQQFISHLFDDMVRARAFGVAHRVLYTYFWNPLNIEQKNNDQEQPENIFTMSTHNLNVLLREQLRVEKDRLKAGEAAPPQDSHLATPLSTFYWIKDYCEDPNMDSYILILDWLILQDKLSAAHNRFLSEFESLVEMDEMNQLMGSGASHKVQRFPMTLEVLNRLLRLYSKHNPVHALSLYNRYCTPPEAEESSVVDTDASRKFLEPNEYTALYVLKTYLTQHNMTALFKWTQIFLVSPLSKSAVTKLFHLLMDEMMQLGMYSECVELFRKTFKSPIQEEHEGRALYAPGGTLSLVQEAMLFEESGKYEELYNLMQQRFGGSKNTNGWQSGEWHAMREYAKKPSSNGEADKEIAKQDAL